MRSSSAAIASRRRRRRLARLGQEVGLPVLVLAVVIGVWEACVHIFKIPVYLLPAPSAVWVETIQIGWTVASHTLATLNTVMLGFIASVVISLPLAVLLTSSRAMANALYPLLVLTQSIPKVALAPLLVVVLGANELPRVVVTFLVAFFPLVLSTAAGLIAVPAELIELGRSCKASRLQELLRIRMPYAIPFIFSGLKAAIALSVVGAVVAEFVNADRGLGYFIITATAFFKVPAAWGALIILSVMGIVLFQLVVMVERILFPWAAGDDKPTL